jgi:hypothetical protein
MELMRTTMSAAIGAAGLVCLIGHTSAAELTGAELKTTFSGKTTYLETTATSTGGQGQGVIYYAPDGTSLYRTAKGTMLHGTWTIKDNTLCNDWKEAPNNPCSKYDKQGDTFTVINASTGQARGKVVKVVDGNPEKLAP